LALSTQKTYTHWVKRYCLFLRAFPGKELTSERKLEAFLSHLARAGVAAATQNQAFNAILFFYREILKVQLGEVHALRARRPPHLRECPSEQEVTQLLAGVPDLYGYPTRLIAHLLYACGLRVSEPLNLRIKDVDLGQRQLYIHQSKGKKDRVVQFPGCLTQALEKQLAVAKSIAAHDQARHIPVPLPGLLAKKYPNAPFTQRWAWLFPSHSLCRDPRSGNILRWRCHESNVQRAVRQSARECHLEGVTPHSLRHSYATHTLHGGAYVRDVQVVLGHNHLETTMRYLHAEAGRVNSPLRDFQSTPTPPQRDLNVH
jgi:integron integrase